MQDEPTTYKLSDICRIYRISETTVFRRLKESRDEGKNSIVLPLDFGGQRRGLRWDAEQVRAAIQAQATQPPPQPPPPSSNQIQKRFDKSTASLRKLGVKIGNDK